MSQKEQLCAGKIYGPTDRVSGNDPFSFVTSWFEWKHLGFHLQYLQDPARAALFGKPSKGKAIAGKGTGKAQKGHESSDYDSDSEDLSESEGSDIK